MTIIRRTVYRPAYICQQINNKFPWRQVSNNNLEALPTFGIGVVYPSIEGRVFYIVDVLNNRYVATVEMNIENHPFTIGIHLYDELITLFSQAFVMANEGGSFTNSQLKITGSLRADPIRLLTFFMPEDVVYINKCPSGRSIDWCPQAFNSAKLTQALPVAYTAIEYEITIDYSHLLNFPIAMFDIVYYLDTFLVCQNFCLLVFGYLPIQINLYLTSEDIAVFTLEIYDNFFYYDYETFIKADDSVSLFGLWPMPLRGRYTFVLTDRFSFSTEYVFGYKQMRVYLVSSDGNYIFLNTVYLC